MGRRIPRDLTPIHVIIDFFSTLPAALILIEKPGLKCLP